MYVISKIKWFVFCAQIFISEEPITYKQVKSEKKKKYNVRNSIIHTTIFFLKWIDATIYKMTVVRTKKKKNLSQTFCIISLL